MYIYDISGVIVHIYGGTVKVIELKNVSFYYEGIPALKNINFKIHKGESIALKGSNGCGKSTLLKVINGLIFPSKGEYIFNDEIINEKKMRNTKFSKEFHQKIGFVFQNPDAMLFCSNVYDEVAFGPRQMNLSEDEIEKRTEDCLKLLDIEKLKDRAPYHLSGGEKKKVAIASVLSLNPSVITLDEPLNGLDSKSQKWLIEFLIKLKETGKTIILSTHDEKLAEMLCSRTIEISDEHEVLIEN